MHRNTPPRNTWADEETHEGCPVLGPHGLEAWDPQEALWGHIQTSPAKRIQMPPLAQVGVRDMPYFHWLELSFLPLPHPSQGPQKCRALVTVTTIA